MIGLLFPGQGAQHIGMGKLFYDNFQVAKDLFEEASDTLNQDFRKLCFEGPEEDLMLTENTQPCIHLVSIAMYRSLRENFGLPEIHGAAGHSLGEYSAIVASNALGFTNSLKLLKARGQFMQEAVPVGEGSMVAVTGLDNEQVEVLCKWVEEESGFRPFSPANYNAPGQVVASGSAEAAKWLRENYAPEKLAHKRKARLIPLKVSAPFHCSLMVPAQEKMAHLLRDTAFLKADFPIIQNVDAKSHVEPDVLRENLIKQIASPVKWAQSVIELKNMGLSKFVELGPGRVLSGLVKKIDSENLRTFNIESLEDLEQLERTLRE